MPGRQAHGRPLLPTAGRAPRGKGGSSAPQKRSRASISSKALNAFAIAAEEIPESTRGVRRRGLEEHPSERAHKRQRGRGDEEDDEEDVDDEDESDSGPRKKPRRGPADEDEDEDMGSDSDGNEWHVGVKGEDEDSDIDSDEAFGESDEEKFDGYAFSGSSSHKNKNKKEKGGGDSEEEDGEEEESDAESLGSDAIDLATALDQFEESDEEEGGGEGSEEEDEDSERSSDGDDESEEDEEEEGDKLGALQSVIAGFGGDEDDQDAGPVTSGKTKLTLQDLGLAGIKDPHIKRSMKMMGKEEKGKGKSNKLDVPLAKREQDKLDRSAAYEKTTETLGRWIETVKHNRRADHLVFPLAQNAHDRGLDTAELQPITQKTSGTELEQTILAIMEESGLGPNLNKEQRNAGEAVDESKGPKLSQAEQQELNRQRRRERELHSREVARAKRIKKIKSKAYRRIHRKELLREQEAEQAQLAEEGLLDSDEERENQDRRRALERMGTRHRESKWAKLGKKAGRAVWDDDFRAGLTDMARRKDELRKRIEGRKGSDDDSDSGSDGSGGSGDEGDRRRLREQLARADAYSDEDEGPRSGLMDMKFMRRGEELRKKENDEAVAQLYKELYSGSDISEPEEAEVGRKQFGMGPGATTVKPRNGLSAKKKQVDKPKPDLEGLLADASSSAMGPGNNSAALKELESQSQSSAWSSGLRGLSSVASRELEIKSKNAAWSSGPKDRKSKGRGEELDAADTAISVAKQMKQAKRKAKDESGKASEAAIGAAEDSDSDAEHLPMAIRDQAIMERAFAGADVVEDFELEKAEMEREDDDKVIDNTLPGWGSWVGEGVSSKEKKRHQGRFVTKVEGIKKKDRKDYKLDRVIISEKRTKKNDVYLATQLPFPFESKQQYERSLRLPMGKEWSTKQSFQEATKPRVIIKQGLIAPMSKPRV